MPRKPWYDRWWLWLVNREQWQHEECLAGYHKRTYSTDPAYPDNHHYITHCRYCGYVDHWESWGE